MVAGTKVVRRAGERGRTRFDWLDSRHTFSFGEYHDPAWMGYRALRVINDDVIGAGGGFAMHPHRDMEIISIVLEGVLAHKDSTGGGGEIRFGDVQVMSAGRGIRHSEFNGSKREAVRLLQVWIVPRERGLEPRYADKSFGFEAGTGTVVASGTGEGGEGEALAINQDASVAVARVATGKSVSLNVGAERHVWAHVATGSVTVNGEALNGGDALGLRGVERVEIEGEGIVVLFELA